VITVATTRTAEITATTMVKIEAGGIQMIDTMIEMIITAMIDLTVAGLVMTNMRMSDTANGERNVTDMSRIRLRVLKIMTLELADIRTAPKDTRGWHLAFIRED